MFFRYWKEDGKATVVEDVDRLVYDSPEKLQYRCFINGRYDWYSIKFGVDYLQFTMSKD
jgi:hypothetical protein